MIISRSFFLRLVVDTGIHWKQWSREQAIDYMVKDLIEKTFFVIFEL